jgi:hypothetical protein
MARAKVNTNEIPESKIRQVIWMIKANKTKKACCEHLGIAYNTKRLDAIIQEFRDKEERQKELKKKARAKVLSESEIKSIVTDYLDGDNQTNIAKRMYISPQRVKKILIENNVPIRARGKNKAAQVDHVVQDLDVIFKAGDRVFIPSKNTFAKIAEVYDEEWIDYHRSPIRRKYIELHGLKYARKKFGDSYEGQIGVHYEIYWEYDNGKSWKEDAIIRAIKKAETYIEETGREWYLSYMEGDRAGYFSGTRDKFYPIASR